jgi:hypothetical protein
MSKPSATATVVETSPIPSLTMSLVSDLRCRSGNRAVINVPQNAAPKTHANTITLNRRGFIGELPNESNNVRK